MGNDYEHDVFVSYRRNGEWPGWLRKIFIPLLNHWLAEELGRPPRLFVDTAIPSGDSWPVHLGTALARSRTLLALWTRTYFSSQWCLTEFAHMYAREQRCSFRTALEPRGLIIAGALHDCEPHHLPELASAIQCERLHSVISVRLARGSTLAQRLDQRVKQWAPDIAAAINRAPPFDPAWHSLSVTALLDVFRQSAPRQDTPPGFG